MRKGNKILIIMFLLLFVVGVLLGLNFMKKYNKDDDKKDPGSNQEVVTPDIKNNSSFDVMMFKLENKKQNMVYSPLSIKYALNIARYGADGNTKAELDKVLGEGQIGKYENIKDHLSLANAVFIKTDFKDFVLDSYLNDVRNNLNSEVLYDEFVDAKNINKWIEDKTFNMLKDVVPDKTVQDPDFRMALVNALAIDMEWKYSFEETRTYGQDFTKADGSKVEATMMHAKVDSGYDDFKYYKDDDVSVISKDLKEYGGRQFEYIAILPEKDLSDYINDLKDNDLNELFDKLGSVDSKSEVNLAIPKYEYNFTMDNFKDNLIELGLKEMFDEKKANFSKMATRELFVSDAIHQAKIEFGEKGVKAAAVTVLIMYEKSAIEPQKKTINITFDRPFMYVIRDKKTKDVWFMGTVYEPNLWEKDKKDYQSR